MKNVIALLASIVLCSSAAAQDGSPLLLHRTEDKRPDLLVIGTLHFANPGRDIVNLDAGDVLSERRQSEIAECVELLIRYRPTLIAVEWPASRQDELDARKSEKWEVRGER